MSSTNASASHRARALVGWVLVGIAVLLALMLIPLGGPQALLPTVLDTIAGPIVRLATGA